jgi:hypothetical protein
MANPTTNYGWPMPTATDLVTDLPADFAAFGQPGDTYLTALNPETTLGDIAYRSATANTNTRLGIGSTGNVLTVSGGVPVWSAPAGGGKVLQVVSANYSTSTSSSTTVYADTGLTATITPSSASSKILVLLTQNGCGKTNGNANNGVALRLFRGATNIAQLVSDGGYTGSAEFNNIGTVGSVILDSPATTSATTYKTQFANGDAAAAAHVQYASNVSTITLLEIGA